jgi:Mg/Co/Ni transporter MgtE
MLYHLLVPLTHLFSPLNVFRYVTFRTAGAFLTALLLGLGCGAILALTSAVWKGEYTMSLAMGGAVLISMTVSALVGLALPTLLHVGRANAKIASGPIVLATADTVTLLCYFTLAGWMLR